MKKSRLVSRALVAGGHAFGLAPALALALAIGSSAHAGARLDAPSAALQDELNGLARQARPGTLGISIDDLATGQTWRVNADRAFPMMSVFKAPLGATVLSEADRGKISLDQTVIIRRKDLMTAGLSEIATTFRGDHATFTVRQLLAAAVSHSDNTAADVLLQLVGGPGAVTAFCVRTASPVYVSIAAKRRLQSSSSSGATCARPAPPKPRHRAPRGRVARLAAAMRPICGTPGIEPRPMPPCCSCGSSGEASCCPPPRHGISWLCYMRRPSPIACGREFRPASGSRTNVGRPIRSKAGPRRSTTWGF